MEEVVQKRLEIQWDFQLTHCSQCTLSLPPEIIRKLLE